MTIHAVPEQIAGTLLNRYEFYEFLRQAQDYGTGYGQLRHFGVLDRQHPRRVRDKVMGPTEWMDYQGVHLNPKHANGPTSYRALHGINEAGAELHNRFVVLDCDESKRDDPRSLPQLIAVLPPGWACIVPTKTNYQVVYALAYPIDRNLAKSFTPLFAPWGADVNFTNSLSWNPINRTLHPRPSDDLATVWWTAINPGTDLPLVRNMREHFKHPDHDSLVELSKDRSNTAPAVVRVRQATQRGHRGTLKSLQEEMKTMTEGDGRWNTLRRYITKRGFQVRSERGRDLTYDEALAIAQDANSWFAEPLEPDVVEERARQWVTEQPDLAKRQMRRSHAPGAVEYRIDQTNSASATYYRAIDCQSQLRQLAQTVGNDPGLTRTTTTTTTTSPPPEDRYPLSCDELARAAAYEGRHGTPAHIAYTLGWFKTDAHTGEATDQPDPEKVRNILKNGRKKGYQRPVIPYPTRPVSLPSTGEFRFGKPAAGNDGW